MRTFLQWKGMGICMDFHCDCGQSNHYDGDGFGYHAECSGCHTIFTLGEEISMTPIKDKSELGTHILQDIDV